MSENKIECLKLAMEYVKYWSEHNSSSLKTPTGVLDIAHAFYDFVKEDVPKKII